LIEGQSVADFADKLAALMTGENAVSQNELSKVSGVPQTTISAYLRRKNAPSWEHVQKLARALGVGCEALQDDAPAQPTSQQPDSPAKAEKKPKGKK
jgi:transcriptional regulator with XRE-family HTH domain